MSLRLKCIEYSLMRNVIDFNLLEHHRNTAKTNPFYFINPRHILKLISINIDNSNSILSQQLVG